ncbi:MAG: hypothetical protein GTO23_06405 [Nitrososphaeria archaeon]|nr:hypothetical protein [Nitrososphaeria archaeon]
MSSEKGAILSYLFSEYSIHQRDFMFTSDTKADLHVGRQMGGITVGVLSGLDSRKLIESSEPRFIIENVNYLSNIIET